MTLFHVISNFKVPQPDLPCVQLHAFSCVEYHAQHSFPVLIAVYDIDSDETKIGTLTVTVEASEALLDLYNDE